MALTLTEPLMMTEGGERWNESRASRRSELKLVLVTILSTVVLAVGIFVGGYFLGHHTDEASNTCPPPSTTADASTSAAGVTSLMLSYGGRSLVLDAIKGSVPVDSFLQCVMASDNGVVNCVPSNALLTVPGGVLVTLYQFGGETNVIVTASGSMFGFEGTNVSSPIEANYSVHLQGFYAEVYNFNTLRGSVMLQPNVPFVSESIPLQQAGTNNVIFKVLNINTGFAASVFVSGNTGDLKLYAMGSTLAPVLLSTNLPTANSQLLFSYSQVSAAQASLQVPSSAQVTTYTTLQSSSQGSLFTGTTQVHQRRSVGAAPQQVFGVHYTSTTSSDVGYSLVIHPGQGQANSMHLNITRFHLGVFNGTVILAMAGNKQLNVGPYGSINASSQVVFTTNVLDHGDDSSATTHPAAGTLMYCTAPVPGYVQSPCLLSELTAVNGSVPVWVGDALTSAQAFVNSLPGEQRRSLGCDWDYLDTVMSGISCVQSCMEAYASGGLAIGFAIAHCGEFAYHCYETYERC